MKKTAILPRKGTESKVLHEILLDDEVLRELTIFLKNIKLPSESVHLLQKVLGTSFKSAIRIIATAKVEGQALLLRGTYNELKHKRHYLIQKGFWVEIL
ncbi:MAG: hypothetical protein JJT94_05090 [Bernardetiaceae bacterium]|nr:hypothetical protein [Bernardetiaceae bacterium]